MIIKWFCLLLFAFIPFENIFSQNRISRDADGDVWLQTDTIKGTMQYINNRGKSIDVISIGPIFEKEKLDSLILCNQYDLWSSIKGYEEFEPYAAVVYSIMFSKKMKIKEIRILKREAYKKNCGIDNNIIKSIKKTKTFWRKRNYIINKMNSLFVSRTRVVIPFDTDLDQ